MLCDIVCIYILYTYYIKRSSLLVSRKLAWKNSNKFTTSKTLILTGSSQNSNRTCCVRCTFIYFISKRKPMSTTFPKHGWKCNFIIHLSNSSKVDYANTIIFNHVHSNIKSRISFFLVIRICSKTLDANPMYFVI